jgi:hypothetical protein
MRCGCVVLLVNVATCYAVLSLTCARSSSSWYSVPFVSPSVPFHFFLFQPRMYQRVKGLTDDQLTEWSTEEDLVVSFGRFGVFGNAWVSL